MFQILFFCNAKSFDIAVAVHLSAAFRFNNMKNVLKCVTTLHCLCVLRLVKAVLKPLSPVHAKSLGLYSGEHFLP